MQHLEYLTTDEAATYLRLGERKLYELVATGRIPCSKITGKWLFPRAALDRWVEAGMNRPEGWTPATPPNIVGGSHDPLLEWTLRNCGCGLALLAEGSEMGLARLARDEAAVAAIHLHDDTGPTGANERGVAASSALHDTVVIAFARREQGLLLPAGNPRGVGSLEEAASARLRFGLRQQGAGAQLLLANLLRAGGIEAGTLPVGPAPYATGSDLAAAVRAGEVDCGIASRSVAVAAGLAFLPIAWENFDLVMRRRTFFEPSVQALAGFLRSPRLARQAETFGGYDVSAAGNVRLNR